MNAVWLGSRPKELKKEDTLIIWVFDRFGCSL